MITYIQQYTSPNENFEFGYPNSNALVTFFLQKDIGKCSVLCLHRAVVSCIKPLVSQLKAMLRNDVEFATYCVSQIY